MACASSHTSSHRRGRCRAFATGRTVEAYAYGAERKFTGKERDSESGLDNFGARYDASSLGRYMTAKLHPILLNSYENYIHCADVSIVGIQGKPRLFVDS